MPSIAGSQFLAFHLQARSLLIAPHATIEWRRSSKYARRPMKQKGHDPKGIGPFPQVVPDDQWVAAVSKLMKACRAGLF